MTYDKYIVRAVLACLVDILLQLLVQFITGFILAEAVNILALLIWKKVGVEVVRLSGVLAPTKATLVSSYCIIL